MTQQEFDTEMQKINALNFERKQAFLAEREAILQAKMEGLNKVHSEYRNAERDIIARQYKWSLECEGMKSALRRRLAEEENKEN